MRLLILLAVAALSCGCMALKSPEQLALESDEALAVDYGFQPSAAVRDELLRRDAFTPDEWALISKRDIHVGVREVVLFASWGPPRKTETITTRWMIERTHYYGTLERPTIVVVRDGKVATIGRF